MFLSSAVHDLFEYSRLAVESCTLAHNTHVARTKSDNLSSRFLSRGGPTPRENSPRTSSPPHRIVSGPAKLLASLSRDVSASLCVKFVNRARAPAKRSRRRSRCSSEIKTTQVHGALRFLNKFVVTRH